MKNKLILISILLTLSACITEGVQPIVSPSPNITTIPTTQSVAPTTFIPSQKPSVIPTINPTITVAPTAYPLPENTNLNRKIIYSEGKNLYSINSDGSDKKTITAINQYPQSISYLTITSDGSKAIYSSDSNEGSLFQINIDGSQKKQIFSTGRIQGMNLSRDSKNLVCSKNELIAIYNLETGVAKEFNIKGQFPYFSPDGSKIVFFRNVADERMGQYNYQLFIINSDGTDLRRITNDTNMYSYPQWSPDGSIIYTSFYDTKNNKGGLYSINTDGSDLTFITNNANTFSVSPNSNKIAFSDNNNLYIINSDGSNTQKIVTNAIFIKPNNIKWSPDGNKIAFISSDDINIINMDGTNQIKITNEKIAPIYPSNVEPGLNSTIGVQYFGW